jgi:DNA-binding transcriptional regulator YiaG
VDIFDLLDGYNRFLLSQGQNLKAMRQQQKLTQAGLAMALGVNVGTVKKWEREAALVSRGSWEKLLQIGVDAIRIL